MEIQQNVLEEYQSKTTLFDADAQSGITSFT
jgi:hypothetical protein